MMDVYNRPARNSKHPEPKPKSQNPKRSRDPTNPNHPIASFVPAHVPDQLQPKAFLILDELSLSYHPGQLAFPDSKRPVRTRRSSRSRSDIKQLASPISRLRPQPQSVRSQLASRPARVQASSRPGQLVSRPARVQASSRPVQLEPVKALIESDRLLACFAYIIR
ncbi:hypothetical protein F2Q69_00008647 [Brassica cretica]|uniref:Uncharacterized protein n=1 Tax=Brassica cretica TaxID=69181 RepID=A0A8S9NRS6_BRACR|nr:hypothetical protein F2Q69_00008647 [Brassica cretica]